MANNIQWGKKGLIKKGSRHKLKKEKQKNKKEEVKDSSTSDILQLTSGKNINRTFICMHNNSRTKKISLFSKDSP